MYSCVRAGEETPVCVRHLHLGEQGAACGIDGSGNVSYFALAISRRDQQQQCRNDECVRAALRKFDDPHGVVPPGRLRGLFGLVRSPDRPGGSIMRGYWQQ